MKKLVAAVVAVSLCAPAMGATKFNVTPVEREGQTIRYNQGVPTLDIQLVNGGMQASPLPPDHGKLSFSLVYWNMGKAPVNFGVESISAEFGGTSVPVLTVEELTKRAKSRAMWTQIGIAALAGAAAAASAKTTDHYRSTTFGPGGRSYHTYASFTRSNPEAVALYTAAGAAGVYAVQKRLDATRQALGDNVIQTTTVDPDDSYGGVIVLERLKSPKWPGVVELKVNLGGETYTFAFNVSK